MFGHRAWKSLAALFCVLTMGSLASCGSPPSPPPSSSSLTSPTATADAQKQARADADRWRAEHRLIDMHVHVERTPERFAQATAILDSVGIGVAINLSGGTVTPRPPSKD